jgi:hypothetical protein
MSISVKVERQEKAQAALLQAFQAVQPQGALGKAVKGATGAVFAGVYNRTRRRTGTLQSSHRLIYEGELEGRVRMHDLKNPHGIRTGIYGPIRESIDGMYGRTYTEDGPTIAADALRTVQEALP